MIIDRTHRNWGIVTALLALLSVVAYLITFGGRNYQYLHDTVGATPLGLAYGIISFLIFVFAALLGWRRKHPSWRLGRMHIWMKGHVWLTFLTVPLVFMHAGFRFGSPLTSSLMWVYIAVMVSGAFGLVLQYLLPRLMKDKLPNEVVFEQIPFLRSQLLERARAIRANIVKETETKPAPVPVAAAEGAEPVPVEAPPEVQYPTVLAKALDDQVIPYLELERGEKHPLGTPQSADDLLIVTRLQSEERWHPMVDELKELVQERRQLDYQTRLQHWLHGWILAHAPLSFLLLILVVWHILVALIAY